MVLTTQSICMCDLYNAFSCKHFLHRKDFILGYFSQRLQRWRAAQVVDGGSELAEHQRPHSQGTDAEENLHSNMPKTFWAVRQSRNGAQVRCCMLAYARGSFHPEYKMTVWNTNRHLCLIVFSSVKTTACVFSHSGCWQWRRHELPGRTPVRWIRWIRQRQRLLLLRLLNMIWQSRTSQKLPRFGSWTVCWFEQKFLVLKLLKY